MLDEKYTGNGKVVLLAGGGKIYTDIAARFVRSERSLEEIVASPYSRQIVRNILESGHRAALEFDFFLFGVDKRRARQNRWRIPEKTLFVLAALGGSVGAIAGMWVYHHKTRHWYFKYGMPAILLAQLVIVWVAVRGI